MTTLRVSRYEVAEVVLGIAEPTAPDVDVVFVEPSGQERRVSAFVSRGRWRVRYSSPFSGDHAYRAEPVDGVRLPNGEGVVTVAGSGDDGPALRTRGALQVARDRRHLEHNDGTPFLWLADTWWNGFTGRLSSEEFGELAARRAAQGFSVVQVVAGLYPEIEPFSEAGRSRSGWAWHDDFAGPNLAWFDEADERVRMLLDHDLVPCIVGSWAYYLRFMGVEKLLRHWREMIARWGAFPVVWCLVGEPPLIWYDDYATLIHNEDGTAAAEAALRTYDEEPTVVTDQLDLVKRLSHGVRELEPFGRPITIHSIPDVGPWRFLDDEGLVDFWLLQTGHFGVQSLAPSVDAVHAAYAHEPVKPVINGEVCYEGIAGSNWQDAQRFLFWSHLLSGAAGHSYGAHGLWGCNTADHPSNYGSGGAPTWREAAAFPGAHQLGVARRLLLDLPWHRFESHPEWMAPCQDSGDRFLPYAAGVDGEVRVFYIPSVAYQRVMQLELRLRELGSRNWHARLVSPRTGETDSRFLVEPESDGTARVRCGRFYPLPSWEDWLLIMTTADTGG